MTERSALIAGASGLVGRQLLTILLDSGYYQKIYVLTRRSLGLQHPKATELIIDFDELNKMQFPEVEDVFCCLGTTMKKAGSKEAFRKVDYTYPMELAKVAAVSGASQYLLVSALGARKNSFFFYNRIKGEVEEDISKISQFKKVVIFRPSLLLGEREEERAGEGIAKVLMRWVQPFMRGPFRKYRPIHARTVANGIYKAARQTEVRGVRIYESEDIKPMAGEITIS